VLWRVLGLTGLLWALEVGRLFTVARSLAAASPSLAHFRPLTAAFATAASSVLTLVPPPGGLGAVEGGLTGMLMVLRLPPGAALALVLMDRFVRYWAIVIGGAVDYFVVAWKSRSWPGRAAAHLSQVEK
jgi:uncharacterized protein (TIRG00374 family)